MFLTNEQLEIMNESMFLSEGILFSNEKGRNKVTENVRAIDNAIQKHIKYCADAIPIIKELQKIAQIDEEDMTSAEKKKRQSIFREFDRMKRQKFSTEERNTIAKAWKELKNQKILNRADLKKEDISAEYEALVKKCQTGEYKTKTEKLISDYEVIIDKHNELFNAGKYASRSAEECVASWINYFYKETKLTYGDEKYVVEIYGKKK